MLPVGNPSSVAVPVSDAQAGTVMSWSGPALTNGAWLNWLKLMVTSSLVENSESAAVNRRTYVPGAPKVTEVAGECESANVTLPGAVTMDHVAVSVLPFGKPSSVAVPCKSTPPPGQAEVRSMPAFTTGASFAGSTVIVTSSLAVKRESFAVSLST